MGSDAENADMKLLKTSDTSNVILKLLDTDMYIYIIYIYRFLNAHIQQ